MSDEAPDRFPVDLTKTEEVLDPADQFGLRDDQVRIIRTALDEHDDAAILAVLEDLTTTDKADLLHKVDGGDRQRLLEHYSPYFEAGVISDLDDDIRKNVLIEMGATEVARIISDLDSDDALDLILPLDADFRQEIIRRLSAKTRIAIEEGLSFPEDSAGRLMQREFVAVPQFWTVGKTIDYLRAAADTLPDEFYDIIVIDPAYHVAGEIPLNKLVRASRADKLENLALLDTHPIPATMDQEEVAQIFRNEGLASAPVVDEDGRLIGIITHDDILDVIDEEAEEDILKLGGVRQDDLYRTILSTTMSRGWWLAINLLTAILAALVISLFEASIEKIVALAVLMPIVASMGGNAGTQTMTVAVRALATNEVSATNAWRLIGKESVVGLLNGAVFAVLMGLIAGLWFHDYQLGLVIGSAMITNLIVAGFFGAAIPIYLDRMNIDPAVSSAIFLTTVTDVVGFMSFLGLATLFLL